MIFTFQGGLKYRVRYLYIWLDLSEFSCLKLKDLAIGNFVTCVSLDAFAMGYNGDTFVVL